jgi:hypothetical protein
MPSTPNEMLSAVSDSLRDVGEAGAEIVQLLRAACEQNAWPSARRYLAQWLLMRRTSIAQSSSESRVAEVAALSGTVHTGSCRAFF